MVFGLIYSYLPWKVGSECKVLHPEIRANGILNEAKSFRGESDFETGVAAQRREPCPLRFFAPQIESEEWADVAQLVEQPIRNRQVTSSTLVVGSSFPPVCPSSESAAYPQIQ